MCEWKYLKITNMEHTRAAVMQLIFLGYSIQSLANVPNELYTKIMVDPKESSASPQDIYILINITDHVIINFIEKEEAGEHCLPSNLLRSSRHNPEGSSYYVKTTMEELTGENI